MSYVVDDVVSVTVELSCLTDLDDLDLRGVDDNLDRWWTNCWLIRWILTTRLIWT
jgi:hypothetical protein